VLSKNGYEGMSGEIGIVVVVPNLTLPYNRDHLYKWVWSNGTTAIQTELLLRCLRYSSGIRFGADSGISSGYIAFTPHTPDDAKTVACRPCGVRSFEISGGSTRCSQYAEPGKVPKRRTNALGRPPQKRHHPPTTERVDRTNLTQHSMFKQ